MTGFSSAAVTSTNSIPVATGRYELVCLKCGLVTNTDIEHRNGEKILCNTCGVETKHDVKNLSKK